jgi:hypothetical protein
MRFLLHRVWVGVMWGMGARVARRGAKCPSGADELFIAKRDARSE